MAITDCLGKLKGSPLHNLLNQKSGIDFKSDGTDSPENTQKFIKAVSDFKNETLNNLDKIFTHINETKSAKLSEQTEKKVEQPEKYDTNIKPTGKEETVGISHEKQTERAKKLGEALPERGEGISLKEAISNGKKLVQEGKNPDDAAKKFKEEGAISEDAMSLVRYKYNELAKATKNAYGKPEYKEVKATERKWYNEVVKPMQTAWSNIGKTMMGATDINTGDVVDLERKFENSNGKEPNLKQSKELKDLSEKYSNLQKEFDVLRKNVSQKKNVPERTFQKAANAFRKLKTKPFTFKDENGNDIPIKIQGMSWNDLVEFGAKAIEKTGDIVDGVKAIVEKIKDTDWYRSLSKNDKDKLETQLSDHYQKQLDNTPEGRKLKSMRQRLENLEKGKIKDKETKEYDFSESQKKEYNDLKSKIKNLEDAYGIREKSKAAIPKQSIKTESEKYYDLVEKFLDKKDNVFDPKDAKDIWDYINKKMDKGEEFDAAVKSSAADLGLTTSQIQHAIASEKSVKNTTDKMYENQYKRNQLKRNAELYILAEGDSKGIKILKALTAIPRALKVFGHGTVPMETHVGMSKFESNPELAKIYYTNLIKTYKLYGSPKYYEKAMQDLKNKPTFHLFNSVGLHNDPSTTYEDYLLSNTLLKNTWVGDLQEASRRGFDILKPHRQDVMQYYYDQLSNVEKKDKDLLRTYADMVNHMTGSIKPIFREGSTVGKAADASFFALKLEGSRWASIKDVGKSLSTLSNFKNSTSSEKMQAKFLVQRAARIVGGYMLALGFNQGLLSATGSNQKINLLNPFSSKGDWLDFKGFGKSIGLSSGMTGVFRFIYRMFATPFKSQKELGDKGILGSWEDYSTKYVRGKLSPGMGDIADIGSHHDYEGNTLPFYNDKPLHSWNHKLSMKEYFAKFAPIPLEGGYNNIKEQMEQNGISNPNAGIILNGIISGVFRRDNRHKNQ